MNAWFSPQTALWLSFLSLLSLTACLSEFAKKGLYRSGVFAVYWIVFGFGIALLLASGIGILLHQPWYVVFPLGFSGIITVPATIWEIIAANRKYSKAEMRQSIAKDL
jgi:hypothetical protein